MKTATGDAEQIRIPACCAPAPFIPTLPRHRSETPMLPRLRSLHSAITALLAALAAASATAAAPPADPASAPPAAVDTAIPALRVPVDVACHQQLVVTANSRTGTLSIVDTQSLQLIGE